MLKYNVEDDYLDLVGHVINSGEDRADRTGTGTKSIFGMHLRHNMREGFPLLTTKYVWFKGVVSELLWFLSGSTNVQDLHKDNNHIWDEWADKDGNLGLIYGHQWRNLKVDQIQATIDEIKINPTSRRLIVSSWNVEQLDQMALYPCHIMFQVYIRESKYLDLQLYQRSADLMLGVPFNIASYSLLMMILAQVTGYEAGEFIYTLGDVHVYNNHIDQARVQLARDIKDAFPTVEILNPTKDINSFKLEDFKLCNYTHQGKIEFPVAV
jgi:thymidylate synthase